jgi:hypothetical protein
MPAHGQDCAAALVFRSSHTKSSECPLTSAAAAGFRKVSPSRRQEAMPHRISAIVLAVLVASFAVAIEFGTQGPASAAECLEKFSSGGDQAGHWYYRTDRANNRKCWFFEKAPTEAPPTSTVPPPTNGGAEESWFSQLATGMQQTLLGTQDPPAAPATATGAPGANTTKMSANAPKQRSRPAPSPETHRAAGAGLQISPEDRDALFQEFLRRYELEKSIHADPRP